MAIIKAVRNGASLGRAIKYITNISKTETHLMSGIDCRPTAAIDEMKTTKALWGKEGGRQYKHFVQSFAVGEISAKEAHEIAREWAQQQHFKGFEVLVTTHIDKNHIHSHILINSVSYEDGRKYQQSKEDLKQLKAYNDELCQRRGLSLPEPSRNITSMKTEQYRAIQRGVESDYKSWQLEMGKEIADVKEIATSREDFVYRLQDKGITVDWKDSHKYITFTDSEGHKARNNTLEKLFKEPLSKEELLNEFSGSKERQRTISERTTPRDNGRSGERLQYRSSAGSVGEVERKLRSTAEGVKQLTTEGRAEQAERLQAAERERQKAIEFERKIRSRNRSRDHEIER